MKLRRAAIIGAVALCSVGVVSVGLLWIFQRSMIYQPDTSTPPPAASSLKGATDVSFSTSDGLRLNAWLVEPSADVDRHQAVLYAHGNGGNRADRADIALLMAERGFTVLLLDYRGYGGNPGSPSEEGTAHDAQAALKFLQHKGFAASETIYFGESIGTGVVAALQTVTAPAAIVLRSPFPALADVANAMVGLPVGWLLRDEYPVLRNLQKTSVPVTVVYGDNDTIVPTELSQRVARGVPNLFESVVVKGDHNDAVMNGPIVADAVVRLADQVSTT